MPMFLCVPEPPQSGPQAEGPLCFSPLKQPVHGRSQVVMRLFHPHKPPRLLRTVPRQFRCFCQRQIIGSMSPVRDLRLPGCLERLSPIFADGLQHYETRLFCFLLCLPQQTFVDEGGHSIQDRDGSRLGVHSSTDRLDGLEGAATDKDGEPPEEPLLIGVEQLIAPLDGPAQRLLPRWCVAYTTRQHRQALAQPSEKCWWRQQFDARSEEHTSELQSHSDLVCRLLLEKKKTHLNTRCNSPSQCIRS